MKTILILPAILFLVFTSLAQSVDFPMDPDTKKITYTEVVNLNKTIKKNTITSRIGNWVKAKKYLAKTKQETTSFAFKGLITLVYPGATIGKNDKGTVEFICTIYPKDGKYKYIITNLKHVGVNGRGTGGALENDKPECGKYVLPLGSWSKIKEDVKKEMPLIISNMKEAIAASKVVSKKKNPADF